MSVLLMINPLATEIFGAAQNSSTNTIAPMRNYFAVAAKTEKVHTLIEVSNFNITIGTQAIS